MSSAPPAAARVLFVSGLQIHPTQSGGNLRSFALASALRRHGHEVCVYSMVGRKKDYVARRPSGVQAWPGGLEEYVDRGLFGFLAGYGSYGLRLPPLWITAYLKAARGSLGQALLPRRLREGLSWCDAVVADFPFVYPVFEAKAARGRLRVLSTHNIEHHLIDGGGGRARVIREAVRRTELAAARGCDVLVSCCKDDQDFFAAQAGAPRRTLLVPNGIDVERFQGLDGLRAEARRALAAGNAEKLFLFTASRYGPNGEAFEYLVEFARANGERLAREGMRILVVGNVTPEPVSFPGFTATGRVEEVEPYFAAADAALNPIESGAGTNVKMGEFMAARLPILTTPFGARGFDIEDGRTGFLFERNGLHSVLGQVRRLFDEDPARLREVSAAALRANLHAVDMDRCALALAEALASRP